MTDWLTYSDLWPRWVRRAVLLTLPVSIPLWMTLAICTLTLIAFGRWIAENPFRWFAEEWRKP